LFPAVDAERIFASSLNGWLLFLRVAKPPIEVQAETVHRPLKMQRDSWLPMLPVDSDPCLFRVLRRTDQEATTGAMPQDVIAITMRAN
jgi:hypothetical protein